MSDDAPTRAAVVVDDPWPTDPGALVALQEVLADLDPPVWRPANARAVSVGASYVCSRRGVGGPGAADDPGWASVARKEPGHRSVTVTVRGILPHGYAPGLLALREGALRHAAVARLERWPDVLLVDATGRDHPRRAGLALHLGAALGVPSIGITDRPLHASGDAPADERGATSPLLLDGETVGCWLRTRAGVRPVAVHAAWRVGVDEAAAVVLAAATKARTPQPLREARRVARLARSDAGA